MGHKMQTPDKPDLALVELTTEVVSAYVANNPVPANELAALIESVHRTMISLGGQQPEPETEQPQKPAVNPKRSVFDDYIVCLDDGKKFKSMRRHLMKLGMTPEGYRAKWNLPHDYPMVAPAYAKARSDMAKSMELGRKTGMSKKGTARKKAA
jgi:predicted transcriptional regulator